MFVLLAASAAACYIAWKAISWIRARELPTPRAFRRALNRRDDLATVAQQFTWKRGPKP